MHQLYISPGNLRGGQFITSRLLSSTWDSNKFERIKENSGLSFYIFIANNKKKIVIKVFLDINVRMCKIHFYLLNLLKVKVNLTYKQCFQKSCILTTRLHKRYVR